MSKRVPKRRFKGFEGEWEQRKLSDITEKIGSGKTPLGGMEAYVDKGVALIRSQNVNHDMVDLSDVVFIDEETDTSMKGSRVHTDDVLLNITGASIGRSAVYKRIEHANVNQHVCIIRPNNNYDSSFIQLNLASLKGQKQIELSQSGSGREGLNFKQIGKFNFYYPIKKEQVEIGTYFSKFDKLITLHQQKYDKLQALKKSYLYEMFPHEGESVPKRRFAGFSGDWEWIKLSDIANKVSEKNVINQYSETLTNSAEYGIIRQRDYFDKNISNKENLSGYYIVQPDDFVYNPRISVNAPVGPINRNKLNRTGIVSPLYTVFRTHNIIPEYLEYYFKNSIWYGYMYFYGDTGARADRFSIRDDVFMNMPICCPVNEEQTKIAEFFETFDKSISEINSKLQKLKALKQSYLAEMFV